MPRREFQICMCCRISQCASAILQYEGDVPGRVSCFIYLSKVENCLMSTNVLNRWVRTGDEVKFDEEGNLFIVDRLKVRRQKDWETRAPGKLRLRAGNLEGPWISSRARRVGRTPPRPPRCCRRLRCRRSGRLQRGSADGFYHAGNRDGSTSQSKPG